MTKTKKPKNLEELKQHLTAMQKRFTQRAKAAAEEIGVRIDVKVLIQTLAPETEKEKADGGV